MLFKSFTMYEQTKEIPSLTKAGMDLLEHLLKSQFKETKPGDQCKMGFVSPVTKMPISATSIEEIEDGICEDELFLHVENRYLLFCLAIEERNVSPKSVELHLAKKDRELLDKQGRKMTKAEKQNFKEKFVLDQLKKIAPVRNYLFAVYDQKLGRFFVSGSESQGQHFIAILRQTLGSVPVLPIQLEEQPEVAFKKWFLEESKHFEVQGEFKFKTLGESTRTRAFSGEDAYEQKDLLVDEGFYVEKVKLNWSNRVSFVVNEKMAFSGIKFGDVVSDQADDIPSDDKRGQFMADVLIACEELNQMLDEFFAYLPKQTGITPDEDELDTDDTIPSLEGWTIIMDNTLENADEVKAWLKKVRKVSKVSLAKQFGYDKNRADNVLWILKRDGVISEEPVKGYHEVLLAPE